MRFTPKTEDELARASLLEAGVYPFEVLVASEGLSKTGNEMIKLKLNVFGNSGEQVHVFDYLLEKLEFKLRHFCETIGLLEKYEKGTLSEMDCEGKSGFVKIAIEPANDRFGPKNVVKDYIVQQKVPTGTPVYGKESAKAPEVPRKLSPAEFDAKHGISSGEFDDSIPFN